MTQSKANADLARNNGRVAYESGRPMKDSNPYRRGRITHGQFEAGYRAAEAAGHDSDGAGGDRAI